MNQALMEGDCRTIFPPNMLVTISQNKTLKSYTHMYTQRGQIVQFIATARSVN